MNMIPKDFINFLLIVVFSFFIGLEQRLRHPDEAENRFGTDRTYVLLAILGFVFYIISPDNLIPFFIGFFSIIIFLAIYYLNRLKKTNDPGITTILTGAITYTLAPLFYTQPIWLVLLLIVTVLIIIEIKEEIIKFSKKIDRNEIIILAKFVIIAGIILPLLSDKPISTYLNISPYKFWLTIVAVSSISYFSYLLKRYVFPNAGTILTAILGGLYSSTATTIILARNSKKTGEKSQTSAGIIAATIMMYLRLLILAFIFNQAVALKLSIYFVILILAGIPFVFWFIKQKEEQETLKIEAKRNPLELKTAVIFGILFAFFAVLTHYVVSKFGDAGVNVLSFIVGITDIDPYILSLFQGESHALSVDLIVKAVVIATASNNLIKMIYSLIIGNKNIRKNVILGFSTLIIVSFILLIFIS